MLARIGPVRTRTGGLDVATRDGKQFDPVVAERLADLGRDFATQQGHGETGPAGEDTTTFSQLAWKTSSA